MEGLEHETVAAESDQRVRFILPGPIISIAKQGFRGAGRFGRRRYQSDTPGREVALWLGRRGSGHGHRRTIGIIGRSATVPYRGVAERAIGQAAAAAYSLSMQLFGLSRVGGKRASDRKVPTPVSTGRDRALEAAIRKDEIELRFQPQIEPVSGRTVGVEALARWTMVDGPEELFCRATTANLAERLSRCIQRKALRTAGQWRGPLARLNLSINLLPGDLERPGYDGWLLSEIAAAGLNPSRVTAEIVESSLVADPPAVAKRLARLRAAGVRIAIDDFGTGYSSLAYLTSLPLDTIKIDRVLIADIVGGSRDRIVVKAMIRLARELGLKVVVEGVESKAQLQILAQWGCDLYQGFLGAGALTEQELAIFVDRKLAA
jgi:EAL domain-containing protein (putative c-di-GMP-specific phosphodiesterase class I)